MASRLAVTSMPQCNAAEYLERVVTLALRAPNDVTL